MSPYHASLPADSSTVVRPGTLCATFCDALHEFDALVASSDRSTQERQRQARRCKTKGYAATVKQYFSNTSLLVLLRQHFEEARQLTGPDAAVEWQTSAAPNEPSDDDGQPVGRAKRARTTLAAQVRATASILEQSQLGTLQQTERITVPLRRRPDINYLSEETTPQRAAPARGQTPEAIVVAAFFSADKPYPRTEEVELLSSHSVRELFKHIECHLGSAGGESTGGVGGGFCCIGRSVYVDPDSELSVTHGRRVLDWLMKRTPEMETDPPRLCSLNDLLVGMDICIGKANILSHGPNCTHIFMFKDVRLFGAPTELPASVYPRTIFRSKILRAKCRMCTIYPAEVVVVDDVHSGDTPCFLCSGCHAMFTRSASGQPLRTIREYPYASTRVTAEEGGGEDA
ncbi:snRNA-activating protein of 50kDa MW C terminal-domain-containing protein [Thamnocephalis sphaerospora]|uniref:snRNA-activating protein of 50kDa MW C terminal-domain-containing protein n=1 Tax=Thamnocephalis sphaerospora TaxID=78915 RepID=A0A4P9XX93_9FUNG|nr:snRNA-activating protein of 50kDa MW C terminal-domain-containing protein [Thamnocephalis sphaerospora]|eukprot:RKP10986.1 snRNA-activating protein of 50kDa MW C terminal-domain-containing protein [Thamnocephalis sphaerospora]